jgi:hypothetical protein
MKKIGPSVPMAPPVTCTVSLWLYFGELLEKRLEPTRSTAEAEALRKKTEHGAFLRDSLAAALPKLGERLTVAQETGKVARKGCAALSGGGSHQDRVHRGLRASIREIIDFIRPHVSAR